MNETSQTSETTRERLEVATQPRSKTWPTGLPALRLHRRPRPLVPPPELLGGSAVRSPLTPPPRLLRVRRALAGIVLLLAAWGGLVLVALLGMSAWRVFPIQRLSLNLAVALLELVGACWVGIAGLSCLFVGAYCLMLALTRREW